MSYGHPTTYTLTLPSGGTETITWSATGWYGQGWYGSATTIVLRALTTGGPWELNTSIGSAGVVSASPAWSSGNQFDNPPDSFSYSNGYSIASAGGGGGGGGAAGDPHITPIFGEKYDL